MANNINIAEELKVVGQYDTLKFGGGTYPVEKHNTPITPRENFYRFLKRENPLWMPTSNDFNTFIPRCNPENVARAFVIDFDPFDPLTEGGGKDFFGVEWEYVPVAGGSMVRPGNPLKIPDILHWEDYITFPDLNAIDWAESARKAKPYLHEDKVTIMWCQTGIFERLISFVEFENAALAFVDEDEQEAVHRLFDKLVDFYDKLFGIYKEYYNADGVYFHDDWGSQRSPFFSLNTVREMVAPYLKRVADSLHKRGMYLELHSCGKIDLLIPAMIECDVDIWSGQVMNDRKAIMDKFGDKLILNISPDLPMDPNLTEAEITEKTNEFLDSYKDYYRSIIASGVGASSQLAQNMIYTRTREAFAK